MLNVQDIIATNLESGRSWEWNEEFERHLFSRDIIEQAIVDMKLIEGGWRVEKTIFDIKIY